MPETLCLAEPFRALFYAPYYLADLQGRFAAEGLRTRFETAGSPALAAEAVLDGRADLAWSGPMRVMQLRSRGDGRLRAFCAVATRDPFLLVGGAPRPGGGFRLEDLAGLRLGLVAEVPTPVWCLDDALAGRAEPAERVTGRPMEANLEAALRGEIDAAQVFEPYAALAEARGGAVWHAQASAGPMAYSALYATEATLRDRRPALRAAVRALAGALDWLRGAEAAEAARLLAPLFAGWDEAVLTRAVARYQFLGLWADGPRFPRAAYDALGRAMLRAGALEGAAAPDFALCVDESVVEEALAG